MNEKRGLIYTDTLRLAAKYGCDRERIRSLLDRFVHDSQNVGMFWEMLDLGDRSFDFFFEQECDWQTYLEILDEYSNGIGIDPQEGYGLFIIGGDDVIPMPRVVNEAAKPGPNNPCLEADFLYCFEPRFVIVDELDFLDFPVLMSASPRFYVGRLPLEDGNLTTTPEEDLGDYFSRSVNEYRINDCRGIKVSDMLVTVTADAEKTGAEIARNIPSISLPSNIYFKNNQALSPELDLRSPGAAAMYRDALEKADCLMFVLHGGSSPGHAVYVGHREGNYYPAFDISCLKASSARVINAVCCWGARFVGYDRSDSIMLSAIYDKVLLFAGSCRSVPGRFNRLFHSIFPIGFGETFLKYYTNYLFQGYDAGYAMMRSKLDYFSTFSVVDKPEMAFGTITMFNLFGNPLLNVEPVLKRAPVILTDGVNIPPTFKGQGKGIMRTRYEMLYQRVAGRKNAFERSSWLSGATLDRIKMEVNRFVKDEWGMAEDNLSFIRRFHSAGGTGFQFNFERINDGFSFSVCVETDLLGRIKDVIYEY